MPEKGPVHAHAGIIEYYKNEERVHLERDARVEQDGALVTGDSIEYYIAEQLVKANSDQTTDGNRVKVVIPPSVQSEADSSQQQDIQPADSTSEARPAPTEVAPDTQSPGEDPAKVVTPSENQQPDTTSEPTTAQQEGDASGATPSE